MISATGSFARQAVTGVVAYPTRAEQEAQVARAESETEPTPEVEAAREVEPASEVEPAGEVEAASEVEPVAKAQPQIVLPPADSRPTVGERFVLQFSTGESFTVFGSGLIGRNPHAEPGEYFDQIVRVLDPSRSVSKTHLEFGQEEGGFWVKDRFSGNGTIVREPESTRQRCHPDRRYRLVRGSRVDMGEQFFILS
ncbi:MAG: FHA domain-containing protein [Terrimesophilobacter sp.]